MAAFSEAVNNFEKLIKFSQKNTFIEYPSF